MAERKYFPRCDTEIMKKEKNYEILEETHRDASGRDHAAQHGRMRCKGNTGRHPRSCGNTDRRNHHCSGRDSGLDPLKQTGIWKYPFTTCVYENALTRDTDNNICPGVCDFELSDDMLTLKLWVRENMVFHNGDPVEITVRGYELSLRRDDAESVEVVTV